MNSSFSFKSSGCNSSYNSNCPAQNSWCGKVLNKFFPPNKGDGRCLFFRLYPFFCVWDTVVVFSFSKFAFIIKRVTKKGVNWFCRRIQKRGERQVDRGRGEQQTCFGGRVRQTGGEELVDKRGGWRQKETCERLARLCRQMRESRKIKTLHLESFWTWWNNNMER